MKDKNLKQLLDKLNEKKTIRNLFIRTLSDHVEFAKYITPIRRAPTTKISPVKFDRFYFIKNENGVYVATVYDMCNDLHWYVLFNFRKKGYLTNAMRNVILPHLFQEYDELRITINENLIGFKNMEASERVALNLGFEKVSTNYYGSEYILPFKKIESEVDLNGKNTGVPIERLREIQNQITSNLNSLLLIKTEIEMKLGTSICSEELEYYLDELRKLPNSIEDTWWNRKNTWNSER